MLAEDVAVQRGAPAGWWPRCTGAGSPPVSMHARRFLLARSIWTDSSFTSDPWGKLATAFLGRAAWYAEQRVVAGGRTPRGRPGARGRRSGRSLPAAILVDLGRRTSIRRLREAQRVDGISFTVHPKLNPVRPWLRPAGAIDGKPRRPTSTAITSVLQTVRGHVPELQGRGGAIGLLRLGQEGAVAAPRFGVPRRRHGHRPRGASCGATPLAPCGQAIHAGSSTSLNVLAGNGATQRDADQQMRRCPSPSRARVPTMFRIMATTATRTGMANYWGSALYISGRRAYVCWPFFKRRA